MTAIIVTDHALISVGVAHVLGRIAPAIATTCFFSATSALAFLVNSTSEVYCAVVDLDVRDGTRMREVIALRSVSPTLPLVVLTALRRDHEVAHARELECTAYLEKSADLAALDAALSAALSRRAFHVHNHSIMHPPQSRDALSRD